MLEGESAEERLLQRTGWFNAMVREHPKDVQLWLRFAAFQLEFLPLQRRPNLLPVLEKQSAILSRALSTCGDDAVLIDRYMAVAEARFDTDATTALWSSVSLSRAAGNQLAQRDANVCRAGAREIRRLGHAVASLHQLHKGESEQVFCEQSSRNVCHCYQAHSIGQWRRCQQRICC